MTASPKDNIERQVLLAAPRERVWEALVDAERFGAWFGARFDGPFVAGTSIGGCIEPTTMDPTIAAMQAPHAGTPLRIEILIVEPQVRFAFRWRPAVDAPATDATQAPMTRVEFTLTEVDGGVLLTVCESGFEGVPSESRATLLERNSEGWRLQMQLIGAYVAVAR